VAFYLSHGQPHVASANDVVAGCGKCRDEGGMLVTGWESEARPHMCLCLVPLLLRPRVNKASSSVANA